jgi:adenine-specific DNA-methyltransferase
MNRIKNLGQVYTPEWVVKLILDEIGYGGCVVLDSDIFEPGFGNGAFLIEIIKRYVAAALNEGWSKRKIQSGLAKHIHGVEVDLSAYEDFLNRVGKVSQELGFKIDLPNVRPESILETDLVEKKYDYVVGNPPYVRIHNLGGSKNEIQANFAFCESGMIDLFLVFFEIGIKSLKQSGKLGFITPNSYFRNRSSRRLRSYIKSNYLLKKIVDFRSEKVFENVSTYTCITLLDAEKKNSNFSYEIRNKDGGIVSKSNVGVLPEDGAAWILATQNEAEIMKKVASFSNDLRISDVAVVQYGFATLRDSLYIRKESEWKSCVGEEVNGKIYFDVIKASRYKTGLPNLNKILFPYSPKSGGGWDVMSEDDISRIYPKTYRYLLNNRNELELRTRDAEVPWYAFGRSQGISKMHREKLLVNPMVKDKIYIRYLNESEFVYSGIFLTLKEGINKDCFDQIIKTLQSDLFLEYSFLNGKAMGGGYRTLTSRLIADFPLKV